MYEMHYKKHVEDSFEAGRHFYLGAADGCDLIAQAHLAQLIAKSGEKPSNRVTVFNKGDKDQRLNSEFNLKNGFSTYPDRDLAMIEDAIELIAWLPQYGAATSGVMFVIEAFVLKKELISVLPFGGWKRLAKDLVAIRHKHVPRESEKLEQKMRETYTAAVFQNE